MPLGSVQFDVGVSSPAVQPQVAAPVRQIGGFRSQLVCGDVVHVLAKHPVTHKFDVIIADPPYNIGKDFGTSSDTRSLGEYIEWCQRWINQCLDLLSFDGILYIYGFPEILARVASTFPIDHQRWLAWHYTNKTVPSLKFWQRSHESILCLWKPDHNRPCLEVDQIREPYTQGYKTNIGRPRAQTVSRFAQNGGRSTTYQDNGGALPRDVLKVPALAGGAGASERWFMCLDCDRRVYPPSEINKHRDCNTMKHPTQKPMELTRRLIQSRINGSGGRVLIPFAGSGSECVLCEQLGLEWLGIEINQDYVEFANKWLAQCNVSSGARPSGIR